MLQMLQNENENEQYAGVQLISSNPVAVLSCTLLFTFKVLIFKVLPRIWFSTIVNEFCIRFFQLKLTIKNISTQNLVQD